MTESGTATFTNPADYQTGIGDANVSLVLTARGDFKARLTWLKLRRQPSPASVRLLDWYVCGMKWLLPRPGPCRSL